MFEDRDIMDLAAPLSNKPSEFLFKIRVTSFVKPRIFAIFALVCKPTITIKSSRNFIVFKIKNYCINEVQVSLIQKFGDD